MDIVRDIVDIWHQTDKINLGELIDCVDGNELADGSMIDLGNLVTSPAIRKIKRLVQKHQHNEGTAPGPTK